MCALLLYCSCVVVDVLLIVIVRVLCLHFLLVLSCVCVWSDVLFYCYCVVVDVLSFVVFVVCCLCTYFVVCCVSYVSA